MPYALESKQQEIAQYIEGLGLNKFKLGTGLGTLPDNLVGLAKQAGLLGDGVLETTEGELQVVDALKQGGPLHGSLFDLYALDTLVQQGQINGAEAEAFLETKYPDLDWVGLKWGDVNPALAQETAVELVDAPLQSPQDQAIAPAAGAEAAQTRHRGRPSLAWHLPAPRRRARDHTRRAPGRVRPRAGARGSRDVG